MQETGVQFSDWEVPLEEQMATHSSILTRIIPWTKEPSGLQSMGSNTTEAMEHACKGMWKGGD